MTTYTGPLVHVVTGPAAGYPSKAVASGTQTGGTVSFATGEDVDTGTLVEVSFEVDDILSATWTVGWLTGTGLAGTPSDVTVVSGDTGFTVNVTAAPTANSHYAFNYA